MSEKQYTDRYQYPISEGAYLDSLRRFVYVSKFKGNWIREIAGEKATSLVPSFANSLTRIDNLQDFLFQREQELIFARQRIHLPFKPQQEGYAESDILEPRKHTRIFIPLGKPKQSSPK